MTSSSQFRDAFDSVADVVEKAASLPDHRERPTETPTVTTVSPRGEVQVVIHDAQIQSLRLDDMWHESVEADEAADLITATVNQALEEWNQAQLEAIQNVTPDMKELTVAISAARAQLQDAWVARLAEANEL